MERIRQTAKACFGLNEHGEDIATRDLLPAVQVINRRLRLSKRMATGT